MITYIKGDVTQADQDVIAHGVNCQGHFGSGVAGAIKRDHPYVRNQYLSLTSHVLGTCQFVEYQNQVWVNAHTQNHKGYDGKQYADLNAVADCLCEIDDYMQLNQLTSIAIPKIGCGLGGLEWEDVEVLVVGLLEDYEVFVYEL
jgi:O-acetyl-ADP-ribose deacetylase (regulator of RNase III)